MKSRPAPKPINYRRQLPKHLQNDPQVIKWSQRLRGDSQALPTDLSEEQLAAIMAAVLDRRGLTPPEIDLYHRAMHQTTPVLAAPELERSDLAGDLELIWAQPEMRNFWQIWQGRRSEHGPKPDFHSAKALMAVMGMSGISAHADDCKAELDRPDISDVFERLSGERKKAPHYATTLRHLPRLRCWRGAVRTNVAMVRELARLHPNKGIGERLMIDGSLVAAWCKQIGKGQSEEVEAERRRLTPEAGARAYMHTRNGKLGLGADDRGNLSEAVQLGRFVRGYYLVVLADQATGLPLTWTVFDASTDEAGAIIELLSDLYRYWPDCPAHVIAGDSAWDEDAWCRLCEVDYGIHPIFRIHDQERSPGVKSFSRDGSIVATTEYGQLICAAHRHGLAFRAAEVPSRANLRPGKTASEGAFRVRGRCSKGCGTPGMRMMADWSRLTYYPHFSSTPGPGAERYAFRQAMLTRLNGMEGIFDRLQAGRKLGTRGADRTRIRDKGAHESLISLALLSMTASMLADQRRQAGINHSLPPLPAQSVARQPVVAPATPTPVAPAPAPTSWSEADIVTKIVEQSEAAGLEERGEGASLVVNWDEAAEEMGFVVG